MKTKIENLIYGYQPGLEPGQFMPIFEDGQLANRNEFIVYKLGRMVSKLTQLAS